MMRAPSLLPGCPQQRRQEWKIDGIGNPQPVVQGIRNRCALDRETFPGGVVFRLFTTAPRTASSNVVRRRRLHPVRGEEASASLSASGPVGIEDFDLGDTKLRQRKRHRALSNPAATIKRNITLPWNL